MALRPSAPRLAPWGGGLSWGQLFLCCSYNLIGSRMDDMRFFIIFGWKMQEADSVRVSECLCAGYPHLLFARGLTQSEQMVLN